MGILYIVATPIGNLQDITLRAIKTLQEVDYIACEDTRKTGLLLKWFEDNLHNKDCPCMRTVPEKEKPKLLSYYEQNELGRIPQIISLLKDGKDVALVSNAGTPAISDPGFKLIREAIHQGIAVVSIPGPSSILTALTSSGLPTDKFLFLGYLPKKPGHRQKLLKDFTLILHSIKVTIIFFEAPHRVLKTLEEMEEIFGDIEIVICRELTKIHEEIRREKISQSISHFEKVSPKGEFTILIPGVS
ncbi:MAG: 16S rRNA (cytidine(1402)-2'-O)-methyltransferase [bacterium]|nr:16S rRNA (cytidine(1402)-2'-O)-methyltransferase [bacterium]